MSLDDKKPWERPWTTQEMIDNASNWNLAGDAGLLKYLEEFSDKMLNKVKDTHERLNNLIDSAEETSLALNNATNRFMGLRNTQFIESRVYEDDETLPTTKSTTECPEQPKTATEADRLADMKQAIINGLDIIDKYYEKVEIPESDSESENDSSEPNIVYKPVDPYIDRPLPYVIGTAEWHKYWHVGLGHSSSDSEIENDDEQFSESSESSEGRDVPPNQRNNIRSDSESEDYSKNKMSRPVANSTFNDQTTKNMFDSSSDSETGSLPPQVNTVNSNFAEELAAKLGKVESSNIEVEVNRKPIQKASTSNIAGGLFSDEPPPLDNDDIFVPKNITSDLFSGGNGLFDDDDDTDFWNTKTQTKPSVTDNNKIAKPESNKSDLFAEDNEQDDIFNSKSNIESKPEKPVKKSLGLFDDDDDDDESNIFNTSSLTQNKKTIFPSVSNKTTAPIINEEPPELTPKQIETKKPIGGVSILGPNVLLDSKIFQKRVSSSSSDSDNDSNKDFIEPINKDPVINKEPNKVEPQKLPSLFDDSSPLFTDDIFANSSTKKFTSKLFEAEEPPPLEEPIKKASIFDEDELFASKNKPSNNTNKKASSLFDDNHSDDDLFSSLQNKKGHSLFDPNPPSLIENKSNKSVNLFDPNPPELEESDAKSDSQFSDEPTNSYGSMNAGRAFLYDTEPPMLSNESSGIARDQSTRLESEDSSFNPYLSSSRRHSDLFQDTQTADSLLTTRSKISFPADTTERSNLSGIPEIDSMTKIDITASGNESSLVNDDSSVFHANISSEIADKPHIAQEPPSPMKKPSLFDDFEDVKPENIPKKLASSEVAEVTEKPHIAQKPPSLFDDLEQVKPENIPNKPSLFEDVKPENIPKKSTSEVAEITEKPHIAQKPSSPMKKPSLFEDLEDVTPENIPKKPSLFDDFEDVKPENIPKKSTSEVAEITEKPHIAQKPPSPMKKPSLFDDLEEVIPKKPSLFEDMKPENIPKKSSSEVIEKPHIVQKPPSPMNKPSLFEDVKPENIPKKPSLFDDDDSSIFQTKQDKPNVLNTEKPKNVFIDSDSDDDLFSTSTKNKNIFDVDIKNKENDSKKFNYEQNLKSDEDIKIDPKKSLSFEKNIETEKSASSKEEIDGEIPSSGNSPGKLKHNLNINLAALLPGASPPKKNLEKSVSLDSSESQNQSSTSTEDPPSNKPVSKSAEPNPNFKPSLEKSVSFEAPVEHNEILPSAVKERAKIPVKRRPSTRRARQEAIRKSAADLQIEDAILENNIFNVIEAEKKPQNIRNEVTENPLLSPSTDEEDFPTMPLEKDISDHFTDNSLFGEAPIMSPIEEPTKKKEETKNNEDIFDVIKMPPQDLFTTPITKKTESPKASIFSSSDSENDLFSTPKTEIKKQPIDILSSPDEDLFKPSSKVSYDDLFKSDDIFSKKKPKPIVTKSSLFDDDDDDDIFGSSISTTSKPSTMNVPSTSSINKKPIKNELKKTPVDPVEDILDPLEALLKK